MFTSSVGRLNVANGQEGRTQYGLELRQGPYLARFASTRSEIDSALRLRFEVFNLELDEGLPNAFTSGRDTDEFDRVCDHLIVDHLPTGRVVGTYVFRQALSPRTTSVITANARATSPLMERCDRGPWNRAAPVSIAIIALPMSCICCGVASRNTRSTIERDI